MEGAAGMEAIGMKGYNYAVLNGGIHKTRHEAVGKAAILNRETALNPHRVVVVPNVIGAVETLSEAFAGMVP